MNFIIQPYRYALAVGILAGGFLLMRTAPLFWPMYQDARNAVMVMACGLALWALTRDTQGRLRTASGLAVGAILMVAAPFP